MPPDRALGLRGDENMVGAYAVGATDLAHRARRLRHRMSGSLHRLGSMRMMRMKACAWPCHAIGPSLDAPPHHRTAAHAGTRREGPSLKVVKFVPHKHLISYMICCKVNTYYNLLKAGHSLGFVWSSYTGERFARDKGLWTIAGGIYRITTRGSASSRMCARLMQRPCNSHQKERIDSVVRSIKRNVATERRMIRKNALAELGPVAGTL
jgi:hypothetical protein